MIRAFLDENFELLREDGGKDFVEFAKERIENKYKKNNRGVSTRKNNLSAINQFSEFLLSTGKGTHGANNELIYIGDITEDLVCDFL